MKTVLNWKKGTFSTTSHIYYGEKKIGELRNYTFKQTSEGFIRNKKYRFQTKGLFKQETRILDGTGNQVLGTISYGSMMSRATIRFKYRTVSWKYNNGWQTRWSLFNDQGILMKFAGSFSKGSIECNEEDDLLVLTGMFVTNYFQQAMIAIMVAVFIPIWVSVIN
jgi:hypothetical protein